MFGWSNQKLILGVNLIWHVWLVSSIVDFGVSNLNANSFDIISNVILESKIWTPNVMQKIYLVYIIKVKTNLCTSLSSSCSDLNEVSRLNGSRRPCTNPMLSVNIGLQRVLTWLNPRFQSPTSNWRRALTTIFVPRKVWSCGEYNWHYMWPKELFFCSEFGSKKIDWVWEPEIESFWYET